MEAAARLDAELAVDGGEVDFDGPRGDEQRLCDVAVGHAGGGELRDAAFAAGERVGAGDCRPSRASAHGDEFAPGALDEQGCAAPAREIEAFTQSGLCRLAGAGPAAQGTLALRGAVSDLELLLYDRPPIGPVERFGQEAVLDAWYRAFHFG